MASSPLLRRSVARVLLGLCALSGAACEDETPEKKGPVTAADPAEQAKIDQGKQLIQQAKDALNEKKYDRARKLLHQAMELGNESQRFEIEEARRQGRQAPGQALGQRGRRQLQQQGLRRRLQAARHAAQAARLERGVHPELRRLIHAKALDCVKDAVDQKVVAGAFADARKAVADPKVTVLLDAKDEKRLAAELEATIVEALRGQMAGDLKAQRWALAVAKIDAAHTRGDATDEEVDALLTAVRDGAGPEIAALADKAVGQRDAAPALKKIDQIAGVVRWAIVDPAVAALETGAALPDELARKRGALAVWVETQQLKMRPLKKAEVRWAHGSVPVFSPSHADAPTKRDIAHGTAVWILGTTANRALVTTSDPGAATLVQLLDKVTGWVPTDRLAKENTIDWLVPDDQLKGQRVWGPLRPPDALWELGLVTDVSGKDITVQRLADNAPFKLPRQKLRSGRLAPGTKVLTFCVAKDQPAQVVLVPPTARIAKLKCDGGQEKDEDLATLRSKPELLPATR